MAVVIADTSPLQYLFQVGLIELLQQLFGAVQIPVAVRDELLVGRSLGFDVPDPAMFPWMSIRATPAARSVERVELGAGERAVLALALEIPDCLVVLDDAAARASARQLGVATTGTLGILLLGKERGLVATIAPVLSTLEQRGFRVTDAVRRQVLQLADE
jgi:predicted nucleic acid-binding protein